MDVALPGRKAPLAERLRTALADQKARDARRSGFARIKAAVPGAVAEVPHLQGAVRQMKLAALTDPALINKAVERLRANGCHVFVAQTAADARAYILQVCQKPGVLIKGKSNAVKELGIREPLEAKGITWVDTDMGDWINQLAGTDGSHVLAPAAHFTREEVARISGQWLGKELSSDPSVLIGAARQGLRDCLETARYGITGANAITAEEGAVVLMENEGNIRAVIANTEIHIAVVGIHKVVPRLADAIQVVHAASVFGAAQNFGTYCTTLTGPAPPGGFGPREVHVVLVDNGRSAAVDRGYAEAFACINCGSCLNFCPVYGVAGDGYSHRMLGGIGALQESLLTGLIDEKSGEPTQPARVLDLCLGCTRCIEYCPTAIDTPMLTARLRTEVAAAHGRPPLVQKVLDAVRTPARLRRISGYVRLFQRSGLLRRLVRQVLPAGLRDLEAMAPQVEPLGEWAAVQPAHGLERGRVLVFPGCIMEAAMGDIHRATARVLRRVGFTVVTPAVRGCCGALHGHAGAIADAKELARAVIASLEEHPDLTVVLNSAGCGAFLKQYGELLSDDPIWVERATRLADRVVDFSQFLFRVGLGSALADKTGEAFPAPLVRVTYQDACHLALAQGVREEPRELLRQVPGIDYVEMDATEACCGSAGIYALGGEAQRQVSMALLSDQLADARATGASIIVTANPGCLMHLRHGVARDGEAFTVMHLAEFLDRALEGGKKG